MALPSAARRRGRFEASDDIVGIDKGLRSTREQDRLVGGPIGIGVLEHPGVVCPALTDRDIDHGSVHRGVSQSRGTSERGSFRTVVLEVHDVPRRSEIELVVASKVEVADAIRRGRRRGSGS
jgi:hypothetical protein